MYFNIFLHDNFPATVEVGCKESSCEAGVDPWTEEEVLGRLLHSGLCSIHEADVPSRHVDDLESRVEDPWSLEEVPCHLLEDLDTRQMAEDDLESDDSPRAGDLPCQAEAE